MKKRKNSQIRANMNITPAATMHLLFLTYLSMIGIFESEGDIVPWMMHKRLSENSERKQA